MKIEIENAGDLCEVENLIMMAERHHRYFGEFARKGLAALRAARKSYLEGSEAAIKQEGNEQEAKSE